MRSDGAWRAGQPPGCPKGWPSTEGLRAAAPDVPAHVGTARRGADSLGAPFSDPHSGGAAFRAEERGTQGGYSNSGFTFQMSSAYSRMVRSDENMPMPATFRIA